MNKLWVLILAGCLSIPAFEINEAAAKKEAAAQLGEFRAPAKGETMEIGLRDGSRLKGTLAKLTAEKIYLEVEAGATKIYRTEELAADSKWKFFKAEYDRKLRALMLEIIEDKKIEAAVKDKKAAAMMLKTEEKKTVAAPTAPPKVEEKKTLSAIKKSFANFALPPADAVLELELADGAKVSGKINKVNGQKVYLEVEEGRIEIYKRDKIAADHRWKLFKEDFDKKAKAAIDEFKAE